MLLSVLARKVVSDSCHGHVHSCSHLWATAAAMATAMAIVIVMAMATAMAIVVAMAQAITAGHVHGHTAMAIVVAMAMATAIDDPKMTPRWPREAQEKPRFVNAHFW